MDEQVKEAALVGAELALEALVEAAFEPVVDGLLEEIKKFFDTMPKVKKELDFKCPKCGLEDKIYIEGVQNFFE